MGGDLDQLERGNNIITTVIQKLIQPERGKI